MSARRRRAKLRLGTFARAGALMASGALLAGSLTGCAIPMGVSMGFALAGGIITVAKDVIGLDVSLSQTGPEPIKIVPPAAPLPLPSEPAISYRPVEKPNRLP